MRAQWHLVPCAQPLAESHTLHSSTRAGQLPAFSWSAQVVRSHVSGGSRSKHVSFASLKPNTCVTSRPSVSDALAGVPKAFSRLSSTASADSLSVATIAVTTAETSSVMLMASVTSAGCTPASVAIACLIACRVAWSGTSAVVIVIVTPACSSLSVLAASSPSSPSSPSSLAISPRQTSMPSVTGGSGHEESKHEPSPALLNS